MKKTKSIMAALLGALIMAGVLAVFPTAVNASNITVHIKDTGWDEGRAAKLWGGGSIGGSGNFLILYDSENQLLYCIEPGRPLSNSEEQKLNDYVDTMRTPSINEDGIVKDLLGRLFLYVDYGETEIPPKSDEGKARYIAAQLLVWEVTQGERDKDFNYVDPPGGYDSVKKSLQNSAMSDAYKDMINKEYNDIVTKVQNYDKIPIPSFASLNLDDAETHVLTGSAGTYSLTLTDNNEVLSNFVYPENIDNITLTKSGNDLVITAQSALNEEIKITAKSEIAYKKGVICYGDGEGERQDTVSVGSSINIEAHFKLITADIIEGKIKIIKTDGNTQTPLEGFAFEIFNSEGEVVETIVSDSEGIAVTGPLEPGDYTIKEKYTQEGYILDETVHEIQIREPDKLYYEISKLNVKTGDNSVISVICITLAGISTAVLIWLWIDARKGKRAKSM